MCDIRMDSRDRFPYRMEEYLSFNGWHFSRRMCEWASSKMRDRNGTLIDMYDMDGLHELLSEQGVVLDNVKGYDAVYVANMARADYFGSSIKDERSLALFVKDYIDDPDGYEGVAFTRFYADCIGSGTPIPWEDLL